jgi:large subunit ribosomal protein L10
MGETTTKINQRKLDAIAKVKELFGSCSDVIFTDFSGLDVSQITELRKKLGESDSSYRVIKNNYTRIAMSELELPDVGDCLIGPTGLALVRTDVGPAAKSILNFAKETTVKVKGALVGGEVLSAEQVEAIARLPGRDQLIAALMSAMNGPLQNLVFVLKAVPEKLVRTLQAVADQKAAS